MQFLCDLLALIDFFYKTMLVLAGVAFFLFLAILVLAGSWEFLQWLF